jgi:hypothetical protein
VIEELVAFHLAAAVLVSYQLVRSRERRLLPLLLLFLCLALGFHLGPWNNFGRLFLYAAGICGLVLLFVLTPRGRPPA